MAEHLGDGIRAISYYGIVAGLKYSRVRAFRGRRTLARPVGREEKVREFCRRYILARVYYRDRRIVFAARRGVIDAVFLTRCRTFNFITAPVRRLFVDSLVHLEWPSSCFDFEPYIKILNASPTSLARTSQPLENARILNAVCLPVFF